MVEADMEFDGTLGGTKLGPGEDTEAHVDGEASSESSLLLKRKP
jgi:hypothetical protein